MLPSRRPCLRASLALALVCAAFIPRARAETLTITSTPSGASIEINGMAAGATPYAIDYPAGYFHKPHVVFASRLDHSLSIKLSLDGYVTEHVTLTEGPFEWNSLNGRRHGSYFLLKSSRFNIHLDPESRAEAAPVMHDREGPLTAASVNAIRAATAGTAPLDGSVSIASEPTGADIYVDGNFAGQTPSMLRLAEGRHRIELKSSGKQSWSRDLVVTKDSSLTLHPTLSPSD